MRNKTKKSKPSELDNIKQMQSLILKRKKLQQDIQVLDYEIGELSPHEDDAHYEKLDKIRKELLYTRIALLGSVLIIALLFNRKPTKIQNPIGFQR